MDVPEAELLLRHAGWVETRARSGGRVLVAAGGWTTVLAGSLETGEVEALVVACRALRLEGTVLELGGRRLVGATVEVVPPSLEHRLPLVLDGSIELAFTARTHARGRFLLPEVPALPGALLRTSCAGFRSDEQALPETSFDALQVVLAPRPLAAGMPLGPVVDAAGRTVPGVRVRLGEEIDRPTGPGSSPSSARRPRARSGSSPSTRDTCQGAWRPPPGPMDRRGRPTWTCGSADTPGRSRAGSWTRRTVPGAGSGSGRTPRSSVSRTARPSSSRG